MLSCMYMCMYTFVCNKSIYMHAINNIFMQLCMNVCMYVTLYETVRNCVYMYVLIYGLLLVLTKMTLI